MKMRNVRPEISIVIPCYNEAGNITALCGQLAGTLGAAGVSYECVMVDDGSTDDTLHVMKELCAASPNLNYLSFSRNFGHQKALLAGIRAAAGNAVISMDADLQHPVRLVPQLIALWREGYEVVNTARTDNAQTGLFKRATSALFYKLLAFLTGMDLRRGAADFRLIDRKVADALAHSREDGLFLRGMICWYGFHQTTIDYVADARHAGSTKYSLSKMMALAADGVTSFTIKPLRMGIVLSFLFALLSLAEIVYVLYIALFTDRTVSGWSSLAVLVSVLGAATLLMLGIVGEYVGRAFMQAKGRPSYVVREASCPLEFTNQKENDTL